MNPNGSKYFGWNFLAIKKFKTIEFRRGAASLTVDDVFVWVEIAMSFIQAALKIRSANDLQTHAATVGGLRNFIQNAAFVNAPGTWDPTYLSLLFNGKSSGDSLQPTPVGQLSPQKEQKLRRKIEADSRSQPMLVKLKPAQASGIF